MIKEASLFKESRGKPLTDLQRMYELLCGRPGSVFRLVRVTCELPSICLATSKDVDPPEAR